MAIIQNNLSRQEGELARVNQANQIEAFASSETADVPYGRVMVYDPNNSGSVRLPTASADVPAGTSLRTVRQGDVNGVSVISLNTNATLLRKGYQILKCVNGTPVPGQPVFYRYANPTALRPLGSIETAAIAGQVQQLMDSEFNSTADTDNLVEVRLDIR